MSIDYSLSRLEVSAFRGVRDLTLDLPRGQVLTIIGANNSGKSTVLEALAFALQGLGFHGYEVDPFDFYRDGSGQHASKFEIRLHFVRGAAGELPAVRGAVGAPVEIHGVAVSGSAKRGRLDHQVRLFDAAGEFPALLDRLPLKGAAKAAWEGRGLGVARPYARWHDISEFKPETWALKPDNLFVSLYKWKTGPLNRLAKMLASRFFNTSWKLEYEGKARDMPAAIGKAHAFLTAALQCFPFWKDDMRPKLEQTLSTYVGRHARMELAPALESVEDWLAEQLALSFAADSGGALTPLDRMGHGWQSLVRIAALDVLAQYPAEGERVALLFEEPESYLHPHLTRKLRDVLARLATKPGWTVAVTTHSPNMVSFAGSQTVARMARVGAEATCKTLATGELEGSAKFQERLDERGTHEMLFASRTVLCEGRDDVFALRSFLTDHARDLDLDGQSVSITRAGDVQQVAAFAAMASRLGIPWLALVDEDLQDDGTVKPQTAAAVAKIEALQQAEGSGELVRWPGNLERCLGLTAGKADPARVARCLEDKSRANLQSELPDYVGACDKVAAWLRLPLA